MQFRMLIDGSWRDARGGATWDVVNPATLERVAAVPFGGADEAEDAIEAAHRAQPGWACATAYDRGGVLLRVAGLIRDRVDDLAPISTRECGKSLAESRAEWLAAAAVFEWFSEEGKRAYGRVVPARALGKRLLVVPSPVGVVGTITAWNFPVLLASRKWSAALAAGCAVVGRPSELTPMTAMALANLLFEAGVPPGVFNLVNGDPDAMGKAFLRNAFVDKVSFTGSQRVGRILMAGAADGLKRLALELGGSAPVLVFPDVDVEDAVGQSVRGKFRNNGQVCISPSRFFVHEAIFDAFLQAAEAAVRSLVVGDGMEQGVTLGPLVTAAGRDKVEGFVQDAVSKGAKVITGGRRPHGLERGHFFEPTVLTDISPVMRLSCEEVFGPVMPVSSFKTFDEAVEAANSTPYGLAGYVLTRDLGTAVRSYEALRFGIIGVNDLLPSTAEAPFGGVKESGFGREGGEEGLREYMDHKFVSMGL
jgi:succinate-semialdehyde dehydrogenase/glutarate-semialdehyde dehydrogenase